MAPKPKRSWFDVQMAIMTISMASVLGLWNLIAGPDREEALRKVAEAQSAQPEHVEAPPTSEPVVITTVVPPPEPGEKILLGGTEPQTQVIIQNNRGGGGGGGGGGGRGGSVTSTRSS